jgi:2-haloacid dehalogenase
MPAKPTISGIKACVFDAYGTLFDVHSAVGKHRQRLGDIADLRTSGR